MAWLTGNLFFSRQSCSSRRRICRWALVKANWLKRFRSSHRPLRCRDRVGVIAHDAIGFQSDAVAGDRVFHGAQAAPASSAGPRAPGGRPASRSASSGDSSTLGNSHRCAFTTPAGRCRTRKRPRFWATNAAKRRGVERMRRPRLGSSRTRPCAIGDAVLRDRAGAAPGRARSAYQRAQFHKRLVELSAGARGP